MGVKTKRVSEYLVLGAGSAGCVLTNRILSHQKKATVTLVEAGPKDYNRLDSWQIHMPAALTYSLDSNKYNWKFKTVPQVHMNNRVMDAPRGRGLGGSSSINAMVYVRGHPLDYERWKNVNKLRSWGYNNVLPYFKRAQQHFDLGLQCSEQEKNKMNRCRGVSGVLKTTSYHYNARNNELFDIFESAGIQAGYPRSRDFNGFQGEGFGPFDMTVDYTTGVRSSASKAYLHPVMNNKNLYVETGSLCKRILFKNDDSGKPKAYGVECEDIASGEVYILEARKEVILSLGAVGTPQLLLASGVGAADDLSKLGIDVVCNSPYVGLNLQDHLEIYVQYLSKLPKSLYPVADWDFSSPFHLAQRLMIGAQWFLTGKGVCASNLFEAGAFIRSRAGIRHPDIQMHFVPAIIHGQLEVLKQHGFQIHSGTLRPSSKGTLKLVSKDIKQKPLIDPNYLATEEDMIDMRAAVRLADEISKQTAFVPYFQEKYGSFKEINLNNDSQLDSWIREYAESAYHLSCSCSMGSVVDETGLLNGVNGLRVVDSSIMPSMTSGNLNSPTIMIAEKISDNINGMEPLQAEEDIEYYINEEWQRAQR